MRFKIVEILTPRERIALSKRRSGGVERRKGVLRKRLLKAYAPCPRCKEEGKIKESSGLAGGGTTSGSGFTTATDAAGGQAIDKFPIRSKGVARRVRKKKRTFQNGNPLQHLLKK